MISDAVKKTSAKKSRAAKKSSSLFQTQVHEQQRIIDRLYNEIEETQKIHTLQFKTLKFDMNIQFAKTTRMKNEFETLSIINQDLLEDMDRQKDTIRMLEATITYLEEKFDQIKKNTAADEASFIQTFSATEEDKAGLGELMNLTEEEEEDAGEEEEEEEVYCLGRFNPEEIIDGEFNLTSFSPVAVAAEPVDTIEETIIPSTIGATNVLVDAIHTTASIQLQEKPCAMEQMKIEKQFLMNLGMIVDKRLGFGANGNVYLVNNNNLISVVKVYQYDADDHMFVQDAQTSYPMEVFTLQLALDKNLQGSVHSSFYETATHPLSGKLYHLIGMKYKPGYIPLNQFVAENRHRFMAQADGDDNDERNKLAETIFGNVVANTLELHQAGIYHNDIKDENILINPLTLETALMDMGSSSAKRGNCMNIGFFDGTFDVPECAGYVQGWKYRQVDGEAFALGILLFRLKFPLEDCSRGFAEPGRTIEDFFLNHELDHGLDYKSFQAIWGLMRSDPNDRCKIENILELAICERVRLHPSVEPSTVQMVSSECFYTL